jgi:hypothetical protein
MALIVGVATTGRPDVVIRMLEHLGQQTRQPDRVILSIASDSDIDGAALAQLGLPAEVRIAPKGLTRQRNAIVEALSPDDLLVFFDDDFLPAADFLARVCTIFEQYPDIVMATGNVLLDGITGAGIRFEDAERRLSTSPVMENQFPMQVYNGYGCNMVIRAAPVVEHGLRFDVCLPLYGWLEDVDFSRQLAAFGRIVWDPSLQGVHLGTKAARTPGVKFGYSQVANPLYLVSKGTMIRSRAFSILSRNLFMNLIRSLKPEPWVDRRGRLRGNFLALRDLVTGHLRPERAAELD